MDKSGIGELLRQLVSADGPSGSEEAVGSLVKELSGSFVDEARIDALGNTILRRAPRPQAAPAGRIMLAAHMDEIGLVVTRIDRGFLHIGKIGGVDPRLILGQTVTLYPSGPSSESYPDGLPGYIGSRPPHVLPLEERERVIPLQDLRVDLGLAPELVGSGFIRVGDRVAVSGPYTELLGGRIASKAMDNRASVAAMLGALGYLDSMTHSWEVYGVATSQEEIGLRGATAGAWAVAPDLAIAIDVTFAEQPGIDDSETIAMDQGPAIGWGPNLHPGIVRALRETADALEIPYVLDPQPGATGTDAWCIQITGQGIPTGLLSIPVRNMHSPVETVALSDIDRTARLLAAFIGRLDAEILNRLPEEV